MREEKKKNVRKEGICKERKGKGEEKRARREKGDSLYLKAVTV